MNLPPFVYAKSFWEALSFLVAGALALLAFFGVVDSTWAVPATVVLTWVLGFLKMFKIEPELRAELLETKLQVLGMAYDELLQAQALSLVERTAPSRPVKKSGK